VADVPGGRVSSPQRRDQICFQFVLLATHISRASTFDNNAWRERSVVTLIHHFGSSITLFTDSTVS